MAKKLPAKQALKFDPKLIEFLTNEAQARQLEVATRQLEIQRNSELEMKALSNASDKHSREFEAYKTEQAFAVRKFNFTAGLMIFGALLGSGILIYAIKLSVDGNPLGMDILKVVLGYLGGLATGWGITKAKK